MILVSAALSLGPGGIGNESGRLGDGKLILHLGLWIFFRFAMISSTLVWDDDDDHGDRNRDVSDGFRTR